jgi:hypothetical protein
MEHYDTLNAAGKRFGVCSMATTAQLEKGASLLAKATFDYRLDMFMCAVLFASMQVIQMRGRWLRLSSWIVSRQSDAMLTGVISADDLLRIFGILTTKRPIVTDHHRVCT